MSDAKPKGHLPTLLSCFLHFDLSFMLWVLLGALGIFVAQGLGLSPAEKGWMVAAPLLGGSLMRIPVGILADRLGAKRVGMALLAFLLLPLALGWLWADSFPRVLAMGLMLGTAGASFAVALPLASRAYPPERQGLAMGVAAAGNSGTVLTNLIAPRIAMHYGWPSVFAWAMVPLVCVLIAFAILARESRPARSGHDGIRASLRLVGEPDLWWFCFFYSITFGGYVGLSSFLPIFFRDQYQVTPLQAGYLTAACALAGSAARPMGGWVADRVGGVRLLMVLLGAIAAGYGLASRLPVLSSMVPILVGTMIALGMANGAVFQVVPQRFGRDIGAATGFIGALGGLGGFFLPALLGSANQWTGSFGPGFLAIGVAAFGAALALRTLSSVRRPWPAPVAAVERGCQ